MARPVFSSRLIGAHNNIGLVPYIVPIGFTVVIRDLEVTTQPTGGCNIIGFVNGFQFFIRQLGFEPGFTYTQWQGRVVANEGELIEVDTTDTSDIVLSGYLLING